MIATARLAVALASVMSLPLIALVGQHGDELEPSSSPGASRDNDPADTKSNGTQLGIGELGGGGIIQLEGAVVSGESIDDLRLEQSIFVGTTNTAVGGVTISGDDFLDAELLLTRIGEDAAGNPTSASLHAIITDVIDLGDGLYAHDVQILDADTGDYQPMCPDLGMAIMLRGSWDADSGDHLGGAEDGEITFACGGSALSKCTEWGYHRWRSPKMAENHQSCSRMVRADFCGDGSSYTHDGAQIDVYDVDGTELQATSWPSEAEWGPDGATCLGELQRNNLPAGSVPPCFDDIPVRADCGELAQDASLASRFQGF